MDRPRLIYFDFAGSRGEECRIALHLAGVDFEDVRVSGEQWKALKPASPFGSMPILELPGKPPLGQSNAILCLIGRRYGLHPQDDFEAARHEALMSYAEELRGAVSPKLAIKEEGGRRAAREASRATTCPRGARTSSASSAPAPSSPATSFTWPTSSST
jgi:prostaglandin-H2 D-isomerase / glutathione transferase